MRRLADKTQVFPLEAHDSVRTRLTHSHEVSNLARSIGTNLVATTNIGTVTETATRDIPTILAAVGLAHDLGNPPFGHQGECAMQSWIEANIKDEKADSAWSLLTSTEKTDFLEFEGNAQTFRLVTQLQNLSDKRGLNLTYATLATLLKYPCTAATRNKGVASLKKLGVFSAEKVIAEEVWEKTGLEEGQRHPLTWIVEACDDIAYSVMDVEDSVKKGLLSFEDVVAWIKQECGKDVVSTWVVDRSVADNKELRKRQLTPEATSDLTIQKFRVFAVSAMMASVRAAFVENFEDIQSLNFSTELVKASTSGLFCKALKKLAYQRAYKSRDVLKVELEGTRTIHRLMTLFWRCLQSREQPFENYIYSRISENYRCLLEEEDTSPRRIHLICDMVAGMTDTFAGSLEAELRRLSPDSAIS